jgi:hypothetical protein
MGSQRAPFENSYALKAMQTTNRLIDQGYFVVARFAPERGGVTVVPNNQQIGITPAREYYHGEVIDGKTSWGRFKLDYESNLYYLVEGQAPEKWLPQVKLAPASAVLKRRYAVVHSDERSFVGELDLASSTDSGHNPDALYPPDQHEGPYEILGRINQTMYESRTPVMVWRLEWAEDANASASSATGGNGSGDVVTIMTEHVRLAASSAVWDNENGQLVAAQVMFTDQQEIKALRATLANNSTREWLRVITKDDNAYLRGARRGFIGVSANMSRQNAQGNVAALLNPLTGDPQLFNDDYFYVVATPGEDITEKFVQRLDLAAPWPVDPAWGEYLINHGMTDGLVTKLTMASPTNDFGEALRVEKDEEGWRRLIMQGLQEGHIAVKETLMKPNTDRVHKGI